MCSPWISLLSKFLASGQKLNCEHEEGNVFDMFASKTCTVTSRLTVGHLPIEVSRITKFLLDCGAKVYLQLSSNHFRRSPLTQGGLEIPCVVLACYHSPCSSPARRIPGACQRPVCRPEKLENHWFIHSNFRQKNACNNPSANGRKKCSRIIKTASKKSRHSDAHVCFTR